MVELPHVQSTAYVKILDSNVLKVVLAWGLTGGQQARTKPCASDAYAPISPCTVLVVSMCLTSRLQSNHACA